MEALVVKEDVLRLVDIPLVIRLSGLPSMPRGSRVKLDIIGWDEIDLTLEARFLALLSEPDAVVALDEEETDQEGMVQEMTDEKADEIAVQEMNNEASNS